MIKAVIPAAGLGTRFLPASKAQRRDKRKKTVVITGSFISYNYGAMALIIAGLAELSAAYPHVRFIKTSVEVDRDRVRYGRAIPGSGLEIVGINKGRLPMMIAAPIILLRSLRLFRRADLVVDIIGEMPSSGWFFSQAARITVARMVGTPYVIYGSSIGPFGNRFVRRLAAGIYAKVDKILVREPVSYEYLKSLGVGEPTLTADNAFLMPAWKDDEFADLADSMSPYVIFNAKNSYATGETHGAVYRKAFIEGLRYVRRELALNVIVMSHDVTDNEVNTWLAAETGDSGIRVVTAEKTPQQLKYLVSRSHFAIGSRIHFCIAAMSSAVPAICFLPRVDHRGIGMMGFFGLDELVIDCGAGEAALIAAIESLNKDRDRIAGAIGDTLPAVKRLAAANKESAREYLE